jgi:aconitate hydratase
VDYFNSGEALALNIEREFERNTERYKLLKWSQNSFDNFRVVPPGTGIVHQVNVEYLSEVVLRDNNYRGNKILYPDTCIGTDSHTTMVNGLGVLAWGVGGIEAEAVMLGQPCYILVPEVIGVKLNGTLPEGTTATDLVLAITEKLRSVGVVEKFVEFFGPGLSNLPVADRATIANMAPEYGATCGFFPVDEQTIKYLGGTGRDDKHIDIVENYCKSNFLFHSRNDEPDYSQVVNFDLKSVVSSLSGPKRPQDRISLGEVKDNFEKSFPQAMIKKHTVDIDNKILSISDGSVVIAAITSCTNTSNPSVMVGAGLIARNATKLGLSRKPWVKASLAPGSTVVTRYLEASGLNKYLDNLGFNTVGYGCTTCIGNSGPLPQPISDVINDNELIVAAVLSGNRNFEGRIHPQVTANYLASPMLVVCYALTGRIDVDVMNEPLGQDQSGKEVYLSDIWPSSKEIADTIANSLSPEMFKEQYSSVYSGTEKWRELSSTDEELFSWDRGSSYIQEPPYFKEFDEKPSRRSKIIDARVLVSLGNSITTDHISPAGSIPASAPSGQYLLGSDVPRREFNSYGARRGNHDIMVRGTFGNIRLKNLLTPDYDGDWTVHIPSNERMRIYEAAKLYEKDQIPLIVLAGKEYGTGSSRDWAAKGPALLGIRAVIAESFERIHRSNLIGMGIVPCQFIDGQNAKSLGLTGLEKYSIEGIDSDVEVGSIQNVIAKNDDGQVKNFKVLLRVDTDIEADYYHNGGLLPYVLRQMISESHSS